ncbi:hypothetical protein N9917_01000 [Deltaproteobacteria bacterium]|nr:hypothetical protein [Deltaproteobacteria bacterium]
MSTHLANTNVDWQQRATEFSVGDRVVPYGHGDDLVGRVSAVFPAIGMVDVEYSHGNKRMGVEDLQRIDQYGVAVPPHTSTVPAGVGTVSVPGGPHPQTKAATEGPNIERIARAYIKKALYWGSRDRKYRATKAEIAAGKYHCPRCRAQGIESQLRPAAYKRRDGVSEKLLGCGASEHPLFLIKKLDIENLEIENVEVENIEVENLTIENLTVGGV